MVKSLRAPLVALIGMSLALQFSPLSAQGGPPDKVPDGAARLLVGAAKRDMSPADAVYKGGFGLGNGSFFPKEVVDPADQARTESERLFARAFVVDNGDDAIAFVITENIGMFAKYAQGPGLIDIAESVERATGGEIEAEHVIAAGNHSHSGPDTLGAWGGVSPEYLQQIHDAAVGAVLDAYNSRRPSVLYVGTADGRRTFQGSQGTYDLIDNQVCLETADNSFEGDNNVCVPRQESVDSLVRVLQAREIYGNGHSQRLGDVVATFITYAAHPTLGGAGGLHGDWPEYTAAAAENLYGGVAVAWPGAIGRIQPERGWNDRKRDFSGNLLSLVGEALGASEAVGDGAIDAEKTLIRTEVTNPLLATLLNHGETFGAPLMRSREAPWSVGNTVQTVVSSARIGDVAFLGVPGEAYPQIALGVAEALQGEETLFTLGLADDMLGYLMSHVEDYPGLAAITPVNDNAMFNVSPRIGDHVMCSGIRIAGAVGFETSLNLRCPAYDAEDSVTASDM